MSATVAEGDIARMTQAHQSCRFTVEGTCETHGDECAWWTCDDAVCFCLSLAENQ